MIDPHEVRLLEIREGRAGRAGTAGAPMIVVDGTEIRFWTWGEGETARRSCSSTAAARTPAGGSR